MPTYHDGGSIERSGYEFTDKERADAVDDCFERLGNESNADAWRDIIIDDHPYICDDDLTDKAQDQGEWLHEKLGEWRNCTRFERPLIGHMVSCVLGITELEAIGYLDALEKSAEEYIEQYMLDSRLAELAG